MSKEDFEAYKDELEGVTTYPVYKHKHWGEKDYWLWPALIITLVETHKEPPGQVIEYNHTSISQKRLLKVLGLTQDELKIEFDMKSAEQIPEMLDTREV
jgi:hypothetical protein